MSNIAEVIGWKHNHQEGMACKENSDGVLEIVEFPGGIPSVEDQKKWSDEYSAFVSANEYKEKRKAEYDQLNQFELIGEDSINGTAKHKDAILAIKAKFPKPE